MTRLANLTAAYLNTLPLVPNNKNQLATRLAAYDAFYNARTTSATGDGSTDDTAAIESDLDAIATAGGGVLYLPTGVYKISSSLNLGARTHVLGDGMGATILRSTGGTLGSSDTVNGTTTAAVFAAIGKSYGSIGRLTIDHQTNSTTGNGIALVSDGSFGGSNVCEDWEIYGVELLMYVAHEYAIWTQRGKRIRVHHNRLDGYAATFATDQVGVNIAGGYDVDVHDNVIRRFSAAGIYLGSPNDVGGVTIQNAECVGVRATRNDIYGCNYGVFAGPALGEGSTAMNLSEIAISGNVIRTSTADGIRVTTAAGAGLTMKDVQVCNNQIDTCDRGIYVYDYDGTGDHRAIRVSGNTVRNAACANSTGGISAYAMKGLKVSDNDIIDSSGNGLWFQDCTRPEITGNRIDYATLSGIYVTGCDGHVIDDNTSTDHQNSGILVINSDDGTVDRNKFFRVLADRTSGDVEVYINTDCARTRMGKNRLLYDPAPVTPFYNGSSSGTSD